MIGVRCVEETNYNNLINWIEQHSSTLGWLEVKLFVIILTNRECAHDVDQNELRRLDCKLESFIGALETYTCFVCWPPTCGERCTVDNSISTTGKTSNHIFILISVLSLIFLNRLIIKPNSHFFQDLGSALLGVGSYEYDCYQCQSCQATWKNPKSGRDIIANLWRVAISQRINIDFLRIQKIGCHKAK